VGGPLSRVVPAGCTRVGAVALLRGCQENLGAYTFRLGFDSGARARCPTPLLFVETDSLPLSPTCRSRLSDLCPFRGMRLLYSFFLLGTIKAVQACDFTLTNSSSLSIYDVRAAIRAQLQLSTGTLDSDVIVCLNSPLIDVSSAPLKFTADDAVVRGRGRVVWQGAPGSDYLRRYASNKLDTDYSWRW